MTLYFFSGLGADKRAFERLDLPDNVESVFIDWIRPNNKESLRGYAERISVEIDSSKPFILVGFSFGGILVTEMLEFLKPQKTILISSIASISEMGFMMKIFGLLKLNRLLPFSKANKINDFIYWLFGVKDNYAKGLFKEIFESSDKYFSKWGIEAMTNWRRM